MAKTDIQKRITAMNNWNRYGCFDEETHMAFVVIGDSFAIKDDLKEMGFKYSKFGWYGATRPTIELMARCPKAVVKEYSNTEMFHLEEAYNEWGHTYYKWVENEDLLRSINNYKNRKKSTTQKARVRRLASNEYVGTVGDKITAKVILKAHRVVYGSYGDTVMFEFEDEAGNCLNTFTTSQKFFDSVYDEEKGDYITSQITISGTVKKQSEYNYRKQTTLKLVKVIG